MTTDSAGPGSLRKQAARLAYEDLERLRGDPDRRARARAVRRQVASYSGEQPDIFVPDVPVDAIEPVTGKLWYHGLGPVGYANMLRRFKRVLEPLVRDKVESWRGRIVEEIVDEIGGYGDSMRTTFDRLDERDRVRVRHLQLFNIFSGFYCREPIGLAGAGPPGDRVYVVAVNGLHRVFVAQVLGTIDTLPAWVALRTEGAVENPDEAEFGLDDEVEELEDVPVIYVSWTDLDADEKPVGVRRRPRTRRRR